MTTPLTLKLGTRGSPLALAQSRLFADSLLKLHPDIDVELVKITTSGDKIQDRSLASVGGKGLFVKEIEEALLRKEVDLAVHSLKDLPVRIPDELMIACLPKRLSHEDVLIARNGESLEALKAEAVLGTNSLRRRLQIQRLRPDLRFTPLRGNIDTRLKKLSAGEFDGIVLAKAGMLRLGLDLEGSHRLPIIPAPGQGVLAIEILKNNGYLNRILQALHDIDTQVGTVAERRVMQAVGGDCNLPFGALGEVMDDVLYLSAFIASPDGSRWIQESLSGPPENPVQVADRVVERFWAQGGREIVESIQKFLTQQP